MDGGRFAGRTSAVSNGPASNRELIRPPAGYRTPLSRMFLSEADRDDPRTGVVLSGGQWQRLAVARAFMRDRRDLMILDEPSAGQVVVVAAGRPVGRPGLDNPLWMIKRLAAVPGDPVSRPHVPALRDVPEDTAPEACLVVLGRRRALPAPAQPGQGGHG
jgi:hypothetical protein